VSGARSSKHTLEKGPRMERYTLERHEAYRKEQDERGSRF
jgi:hypothetical protein